MKMTRKQALKSMAGISALGMVEMAGMPAGLSPKTTKGTIKHSVCRWCYNGKSLEELCEAAKDIGIQSIELLNPDEWPIVQKYGLTCAMTNATSFGIPRGFNDPQYHAQLQKDYRELIPKAADAGLKNVICFSGNRNGISDEKGLENCAVGLEPLVKLAEKQGVTLCMELLNSKVNHPDYMCDHTEWGVSLAKKLGSPNFKLLYDIYHMQIMEGDVIATIRKHKDYIGHYHTGGVPGRNEIDETQELYYPAIVKAIIETGFDGFIAQEFIPKNDDAFASLRRGVEICDV